MGSGNSSFTPEQVCEISQAIKAEYESCKSKGLSQAEEQEKLVKKYEAVTQKLLVPVAQPKAVVANSRRLSRGYSKDEHSQPKTTRGRRRSFDNKPTAQSPNKKKDTSKEMQQSISAPSLEAKVLEEPPAQGYLACSSLFSFLRPFSGYMGFRQWTAILSDLQYGLCYSTKTRNSYQIFCNLHHLSPPSLPHFLSSPSRHFLSLSMLPISRKCNNLH
jgi:hypothetical protein